MDDVLVHIEHRINQPLRHDPQAPDVAVIEHPGKHGLIPLQGFLTEAGIVRHLEVEIQSITFLMALDPLQVKPMLRTVRVAREPQLRPVHATSGQRLFHKGAGHQGHLVQQYASQRATLDEHERTFILSAKHLKEVGHGPPPHFQNLLCPPPAQGVTFLRQRHGDERNDDILRCRIHGLAADAEPLAGKLPHGPAYKRPHHDRGLARTDSTVADNGVILGVGKGEDFLLLFRNHASLSNSSAISRRL